MSERNDLLTSISTRIKDYRAGDIEKPTSNHVDRWIRQFDPDTQIPLLREIDCVFKNTFFSRENFRDFLNGLLENKKLVGNDPCAFWKKTNFLNIQQNGHS